MSELLLGVDTGGTFTDFVLFDGECLRIHKVLSTPDAPEQAILQGIHALGLTDKSYTLIHGSTVATNAVLERKGVRTAYITNRGFADVLTIGRQARRELYNLQPDEHLPPVPEELCLETGGRLAADGSEIEPLTDADCEQLRKQLLKLKPQAVAINLLFSFLDDRYERRIAELVAEGVFVSRSSAVLPEYREYERGIATWLNAWVGPLVEGYVQRLSTAVAPSPVSVMQSSGVTVSAELAAQRAVELLLSGPAGGLMGARRMGQILGIDRLLSFDMGGTSTDVALIDGQIGLTSEGAIGDWPVAVPMVDMHTIGAGGGSIARVDAGGMLQVGPESAGADPGPACYGRGGVMATVTDANLLLGRLQADAFLGGNMSLDISAAQQSFETLAAVMKLTVEQAALGVVQLANEHMTQALRVISVQRGIDPAGFTLTAFGGAGGLHVCALAEALGIRQALVPVHAGVLSAFGMLAAPRGRQLSHAVRALLAEQDEASLQERFVDLMVTGKQDLLKEGVAVEDIETEYRMDLRYHGQSYYLSVPFQNIEQAGQEFHERHKQRFGHSLQTPVELVNIRISLQTSAPMIPLEFESSADQITQGSQTRVIGCGKQIPVWQRQVLVSGQVIEGPALIVDPVATTWLHLDWQARLHESGCLMLSHT
ncbi:MAG: hydantoinase/oxoprolinase family protein [Gammaproteobacteria bacterium]